MKKFIIAAAVTTLFSTMAYANSGLADRINEARSYPNKTVEHLDSKTLSDHHKQLHMKMSKSELKNHQKSAN
ncbi:hypothetical protein [Marinobacter sp.]|uniref:hypothetical protein n=1 Tax=Marinobacter sp. TaxID=50741 RepID=UPI001B5069EC|nr:hypothetical protein [Marinobacter sp.]MBQ0831853.1 hypothetical protein [Marinobacter sp.]